MAGEEWARRIVEKELRRTVVINDDNSAPGMYDLRIGPPNKPEFAIECIGAVDSIFTETWNVGPARGSLALKVKGNWTVEITATARVKTVRKNIQQLLQELERQRIYKLQTDHRLQQSDDALFTKFASLGIMYASCYCIDGSGKVYLTMPGTGGAVDERGSKVSKWLGTFLCDPAQADVLLKLQRSGAKERHVFVIASFRGTPWSVESYLSGEFNYTPSDSPILPTPVTAVWLVSGFSQKGLYWDGNIWRIVESRGDGIDSIA